MTVPATPRRTPAQAGDGVNVDFDFDFIVFEDTDVRVVVLNETTAVETDAVLNTDYTVTRNSDQSVSPGGTVSFLVPPTVNETVTMVGGLAYGQSVALPDGGAYRAENVEQALDVLAILCQQLKEEIDRCAKVPVSGGDAAELNESINVLSANLATLQVVVDNIADLVALADVAGDVAILADITAAINTVAGIAASVTTVAGIAANVTTVAGVAANVTTVAGISAAVTAVAGIAASVSTVATNMAAVLSAAANMAAITAAPAQAAAAAASAAAAATSEANIAATLANFAGRNKIINGKMDIGQRGASSAGLASGALLTDRWQFAASTGAVITYNQILDAPAAAPEFRNSCRLTVTTADAAVAATDFCSMQQKIEGSLVRDLVGRAFTLSFWVRSSKTGTHCVAFRNAGTDRFWVSEYTVSAANTWERKTITVPAGLITAGTWDWTTGIGIRVEWLLMAGTTWHGTAGSWQTGAAQATVNQVNCLDTIGNIFAITGVQLEAGSVATPFEHRPFEMELLRCNRYAFFATALPLGLSLNSNTLYNGAIQFPVQMRAIPTLVAGAVFTVNGGSAGTPVLSSVVGGLASVDAVALQNAAANWSVNASVALTGELRAEL